MSALDVVREWTPAMILVLWSWGAYRLAKGYLVQVTAALHEIAKANAKMDERTAGIAGDAAKSLRCLDRIEVSLENEPTGVRKKAR